MQDEQVLCRHQLFQKGYFERNGANWIPDAGAITAPPGTQSRLKVRPDRLELFAGRGHVVTPN